VPVDHYYSYFLVNWRTKKKKNNPKS